MGLWLSSTDLDKANRFGSFHCSNPSGNRRDREITLNLSMAATGGEPDREITLHLNHLWIHRGRPTQEVARVEGSPDDGEKGNLVQEGGAPPWTLSRSSTCDD